MEVIVTNRLKNIAKKYGPNAEIGFWSYLATYMGQIGGGDVTNYRYEGEIVVTNLNSGTLTIYSIINDKVTSVVVK